MFGHFFASRWYIAGMIVLVPVAFVISLPINDYFSGRKLIVSPETTFILQPLTAENIPDYLAALNDKYVNSITKEENAADEVLLLATDPKYPWRDLDVIYSLFSRYKQERTPNAKKQLRDTVGDQFDNIVERFTELDTATDRPWKEEEFPVLATWLASHEVVLNEVAEIGKLKYFRPTVTPSVAGGFEFPEGLLGWLRQMRRFVSARGMLHIGEGRIDQAVNDCVLLSQWSSHFMNQPMLSGVFNPGFAYATRRSMTLLEYEILTSPHLEIDHIVRLNEDLKLQEAVISLPEIINTCVRYRLLHETLLNCRDQATGRWNIDPNPSLRTINRLIDQGASAVKSPSAMDRRSRIGDLQLLPNASSKEMVTTKQLLMPRQYNSDKLIAVNVFCCYSEIKMCEYRHYRDAAWLGMSKISRAIASFRLKHNHLPPTIDAVVPEFLDVLSLDPATDMPFVYKVSGDGRDFLIYGLGGDGVDGGGVEKYPSDDLIYGRISERRAE